MRTWLLSLLLVGLATAGGFKWWRARQTLIDAPDALAIEANGESDSGEESAPVVIASADPSGDATPTSTETEKSAVVTASTDARPPSPPAVAASEKEIPGGATSETEAEARRKAAGLVEQAAKAASPIEQSTLLTQAIRSSVLDKNDEEKAYAALLEANKRGILNPRCEEGFMKVEVKKGDSLWSICKRLEKESHVRVTSGMLRLVNSMTSDSVYPGASLKVPNQPLSIYVKKSKFRLDVLLGNILLRRYAVGIGKDNRSPEGKFVIATRLKDPHWFKPGGAAGGLPPEHPENILGTRWLGFAPKDGFPEAATFGIHGTKEDQTIGTESSNGCVRMHNADVEELFEWVAAGTQVEISL
jgi:L,D-transpeptidase-like protein/LysM domain-containing protein